MSLFNRLNGTIAGRKKASLTTCFRPFKKAQKKYVLGKIVTATDGHRSSLISSYISDEPIIPNWMRQSFSLLIPCCIARAHKGFSVITISSKARARKKGGFSPPTDSLLARRCACLYKFTPVVLMFVRCWLLPHFPSSTLPSSAYKRRFWSLIPQWTTRLIKRTGFGWRHFEDQQHSLFSCLEPFFCDRS